MMQESQSKKFSLSIKLISFIYLYSLFALDRFKKILSPQVNGNLTTNEVWIILAIIILIQTINLRKNIYIKKDDLRYWTHTVLLLLLFTFGGFKVASLPQYLYSGGIFFLPLLIFLSSSKWGNYSVEKVIKLFVICSLVYSIFAIILTTNYAFFMQIIGNSTDNYRYYSQYRASMMIGSSITVSYYFNLVLPIVLYSYNVVADKKWKRISLLAAICNILATFILLSRVASLTAVLIIIFYIFYIKTKKTNIKNKTIFLVLLTIFLVYIIFNYDLSRYLAGINLTGSSAVERTQAGKLGIEIFKDYPILGSGMGRYFVRIYQNRYITYDGLTGLVDPHNMYILVLSELGITGLIVLISLFMAIGMRFRWIRDSLLRKTAHITIFAFMLNSLGGSHLINEISYSIIFWITMGVFNSVALSNKFKKNKNDGV